MEEKKTYKVVVNGCHGGFSLSEKGLELLKKYKEEDGIDTSDMNSVYTDEPRHSRYLVRVVEELGKEANGKYARLEIETVSGPYLIHEYDGSEYSYEPHNLNWIDPSK